MNINTLHSINNLLDRQVKALGDLMEVAREYADSGIKLEGLTPEVIEKTQQTGQEMIDFYDAAFRMAGALVKKAEEEKKAEEAEKKAKEAKKKKPAEKQEVKNETVNESEDLSFLE